MMTTTMRLYLALLLFTGVVLGRVEAQDARAARVDDRIISLSEAEAFLGDKLLRLKTDEYALRVAALNEFIDQLLLAREAERRGIDVAELVKTEVTERISPITDADTQAALLFAQRGNVQTLQDPVVRSSLEELRGRRVAQRRREYLMTLRRQHSTSIDLEPPRLTKQVIGGHSTGEATASVSIVVFSDFQCPYCSTLDGSLRRILKEYGASVRLTAKQFPLPNHPQAAKAAEAALCAGEQGRYWSMHENLFTEQSLVAREQFSEIAKRSGLDVPQFETCASAHKYVGAVAQDMADARAIGINSTPTLFINGLMIVGAKPYEALREVIDAELRPGVDGVSPKRP